MVPGVDPVFVAGAVLFAVPMMMSIYPIFGARFGMADLSAAALLAATVASTLTVLLVILVLERLGMVSLP